MENNEKKQQKGKGIQFGNTVEQICMFIMALGLIASSIVDILWLKIAILGLCAIVFLFPFVLTYMQNHHGITAKKVCSVLKKRGLAPVVNGDEIRWSYNGKESILRIRSHCQVEIAREYEIPSNQAVIDGNEKAALETMKEVYLAKVSVREGNGNRRLAFATESLCVSAKEFSTYLPMCLEILDLAEDRQREHIAELRNVQGEKTKRIGFLHPDGTIR